MFYLNYLIAAQFLLSLLARKSNQNAFDLLKGDFSIRNLEAANRKPLPRQALFWMLNQQIA
ncbi:MAG: hypothetical protein H0U95_02070 [Bacteroidetes bacterium]|nr:hypothetical protein [Bacteroidota bacterium]